MVARQRNLPFASQAVSIGSLMGIRPLYLLMDIKSAKVCTSPKIFFRASSRATGCAPFRSGYKLALKSPNAHRLGKNERVAPKKLLPGRTIGHNRA